MGAIRLFVSIPVASFRVSQAREYWESYPCAPPSTIYGMLLSLIGEENLLSYAGTRIAVSIAEEPSVSVILRSLWRIKSEKLPQGQGENVRPDFQELLTGVKLSVWVRDGIEVSENNSLHNRLWEAFRDPSSISRYGGLSLGESTHLVDEIRPWRDTDPEEGRMLVPDVEGDLSLPVWVNHVGSRGTRWVQCRLGCPCRLPDLPSEELWFTVAP